MAREGQSPFPSGWLRAIVFLIIMLAGPVHAAPYAAMVIDARTGEVLHSRNADTRLHPASLTKMMTLYIAFEAVENGEIGLDDKVTISRNAAAEPPSKLGLRAGQKIAFRYLIRAAAVKSANDAATAIGEALEGSEGAFAARMNRTAKALGMTKTTFRNAHGLTQSGHLSTARDMTTLGRHLFYDYPQYYNLFSRRSTDAGIKTVSNTNRRLLGAYRGADGIKTGYTRAAGFNLVASAERGQERIIATMFGGSSSRARNARVAELLDMGFNRAPSRVAVQKPGRPVYGGGGGGGVIRNTQLAVLKSPAPMPRPMPEMPETVTVALREDIERTLAIVDLESRPAAPVVDLTAAVEPVIEEGSQSDEIAEDAVVLMAAATPDLTYPAPRPGDLAPVDLAPVATEAEEVAAIIEDLEAPLEEEAEEAPELEVTMARVEHGTVFPMPRPAASAELADLVLSDPVSTSAAAEEVVTRMSTSGGQHWAISVGRFGSRHQAERKLLETALLEMSTLDRALRKVVPRKGGYEANFVGLSEEQADLACRRLSARNLSCDTLGPS